MQRSSPAIALAALLATTALAAGCTSSGTIAKAASSSRASSSASSPAPRSTSPAPTTTTTTTQAQPPSPPGSAPHVSDSDLVRYLTVPVEKVNSTWSAELLSGGGDTLNQRTLDLCGGSFPSDDLRTARRQTVYSPGDGTTPVSNEVVTYKSGGVDKAKGELAAAIGHCPSGMVKATDYAGGMASYKVQKMVVTGPTWLPGTIAIVVEVNRDNGEHYFTGEVFQFRGNVMSVVYGDVSGQALSSEAFGAADSAAAQLMQAFPDSNPV